MPQLSARETLERLAGELHDIAFDFDEVAWSHREADRRKDVVERICEEARALVRGSLRVSAG